MPEQLSEFLIGVSLLLFFTSLLAAGIIGIWYTRTLGKLLVVAKDVDPVAWADWGGPRSLQDMGHRRQLMFYRAVSRRKGINAALQAHPTYQLARKLSWVTGIIVGLLFTSVLIVAALDRYLGDPGV